MALLDQEVLGVVTLVADLLEPPQPPEPRGQDPVEQHRDPLAPPLPLEEQRLPVDVPRRRRQLPLEPVVRVPVLEGVAAVPAPEEGPVREAREVAGEELEGREVVLGGQEVEDVQDDLVGEGLQGRRGRRGMAGCCHRGLSHRERWFVADAVVTGFGAPRDGGSSGWRDEVSSGVGCGGAAAATGGQCAPGPNAGRQMVGQVLLRDATVALVADVMATPLVLLPGRRKQL